MRRPCILPLLSALLAFTGIVQSQTAPQPSGVAFVDANPAGACVAGNSLAYSSKSNSLWACQAGAWTQIGGGVRGTLGSGQSECTVTRTSAKVLTVCPNASPATPSLWRFGGIERSVTAPCTATISAGTSTLYVEVDNAGKIQLGGNFGPGGVVAGPNCGAAYTNAVTAFTLENSRIPVETWHGTGGAWDATGTLHLAYLSTAPKFLPGANIDSIVYGPGGTATINAATQAAGALGGAPFQTFHGYCKGPVQKSAAGASVMLLGGDPAGAALCNNASLPKYGSPTTRACHIQNLWVVASAAGADAADGVFTLQDESSATLATCTIGTGTSCTYAGPAAATVTAGHRLWIKGATNSTSLADITVSFECQ